MKKVMSAMTGVLIKTEAPRMLSLCAQQVILSVLPGRSPELHSEEIMQARAAVKKGECKGRFGCLCWTFWVYDTCFMYLYLASICSVHGSGASAYVNPEPALAL